MSHNTLVNILQRQAVPQLEFNVTRNVNRSRKKKVDPGVMLGCTLDYWEGLTKKEICKKNKISYYKLMHVIDILDLTRTPKTVTDSDYLLYYDIVGDTDDTIDYS